jgi:hypothetical protein
VGAKLERSDSSVTKAGRAPNRRLAQPKGRLTTRHALTVVTLVLVAAGALVATAVLGSRQDWGPLAVVPASPATMEAATHGRIQILDSCVYLRKASGERVLLIWPADRTKWLGATHTIALTNRSGVQTILRDGDQVELGGGGDDVSEGGVAGDQFLQTTEWVAAPRPWCEMDARWSVGEAIPAR